MVVPAVVAMTLAEGGWYVGAAVVFALAVATDFFDGYLARRWGITTILGAFLDSTADKLLVTGALLALVANGRASVWAALVIVGREFVVMALRGIVALEGAVVKPSLWGKAKAGIQFLAIFLAMLRPGEPLGPLYLDEWVMWAAAIVTIASGWQYASSFWSVVRSVDSEKG